jgi:hypothetical protein
LVTIRVVRVGYLGEFIANADSDHSIAVQFRGSQQGFQYGLLLAHDFLRSRKKDDLFRSAGTRRQNLSLTYSSKCFQRQTTDSLIAKGAPVAVGAIYFPQSVCGCGVVMEWRHPTARRQKQMILECFVPGIRLMPSV